MELGEKLFLLNFEADCLNRISMAYSRLLEPHGDPVDRLEKFIDEYSSILDSMLTVPAYNLSNRAADRLATIKGWYVSEGGEHIKAAREVWIKEAKIDDEDDRREFVEQYIKSLAYTHQDLVAAQITALNSINALIGGHYGVQLVKNVYQDLSDLCAKTGIYDPVSI